MRRSVAVASVLAVVACTLTACSASPGDCLPEPLEVSSATVAPGESVIVSSPAAACATGTDRTYALVLHSEVRTDTSTEPVVTDVAADGSFSTEIPVPSAFPGGPASVVVTGSAFDECTDEGSCAAYQAEVEVTS
ncbi:hypothetical protein SAMN04489860_1076 [Paraoerskovia marina]|uniref:Uncharacterized protein n=1 Tax=Paraoerskovia marina TaxID=545619 RepID=A0A1H1QFZ8_9CELL|nr:hypothetical protein [Paraoerskovia marina]SDS22370.1 hypothetical protein SAMN04489860_1076 [Paraoerskovia marina]